MYFIYLYNVFLALRWSGDMSTVWDIGSGPPATLHTIRGGWMDSVFMHFIYFYKIQEYLYSTEYKKEYTWHDI